MPPEQARDTGTQALRASLRRDLAAGYTAEAGRYEALGQQAAAARLRAQGRLLAGYLD